MPSRGRGPSGRRSTIFGMTAAVDAFPEAAALAELAEDTLRGWFETYRDAGAETASQPAAATLNCDAEGRLPAQAAPAAREQLH